MKSLNKEIILLGITGLMGVASLSIEPPTVYAQQEVCRDAPVEASEELRTVELPQFGIDIDIPANYRAIAFDRTHVGIMNPGDWALVSCLRRGGEALFARGMFSFNIYKSGLSTPQAVLEAENKNPRYWIANQGETYTYNLDGTKVTIIEDTSGYGVSALFTPPTVNGVIIMKLSCDCEVNVETMVRELDQTRLRD